MRQFTDEDRNIKFFHAYVNGRRRKLNIDEIYTEEGDIIDTGKNIGTEAMRFFACQFKEGIIREDYEMLNCIPQTISDSDNKELTGISSREEIKKVVFVLKGDNSNGLDSFSETFYQYFLDIVGEDIERMVRAFYCEHQLPRFITHTNLLLISKKKKVKHLTVLRPISLYNFINKIFLRMMLKRLSKVIPKIISKNQFEFVKGKSIAENVLLAQKIIRDINKKNKHNNVVVKLDMTKTYDGVS